LVLLYRTFCASDLAGFLPTLCEILIYLLAVASWQGEIAPARKNSLSKNLLLSKNFPPKIVAIKIFPIWGNLGVIKLKF